MRKGLAVLTLHAVAALPAGHHDPAPWMSEYDTARCVDRRPPPAKRAFVSAAVDKFVDDLSSRMTGDATLACLLRNTFPNTLDTTVRLRDNGNPPFIVTGDIDAMWLRDSFSQLTPYMPFVVSDANISELLVGVLRTQTRQIIADPYANAHYDIGDGTGESPNIHDVTSSRAAQCSLANGSMPTPPNRRRPGMVPGIYERKYELDSLLAFLKLGRHLFEAATAPPAPNATSALANATWTWKADTFPRPWLPVDDPFAPYDDEWLLAVGSVLDVLEDQMKSSAADDANPCGPAYSFSRNNIQGQGPLSTLLNGVGPPAAFTGMIRSAFRPSDDACTFSFHIPSNAMAVVELRGTATLLRALEHVLGPWSPRESTLTLATRCEVLAASIADGIATFGIVERPELGGRVYAYEVDGYGNAILMDDANVPSLLSLPWLGFVAADDPTYVRTRAYVLSARSNPWYFKGVAGEGIGGPHIGPSTIWPMAIIMRALTSVDDAEIADALATLKKSAAVTDAGAWLMHESFEAADASTYTRPWFAWCNALLGSLLVKLSHERPQLVGIP